MPILFILSILSIVLLPGLPARAARIPARLLSGREVVDLVNQLRLANSLAPYKVNKALMAAAQAHSDYQASIGQVTHTGLGGTRPRDRAIAYRFGGGATVYVSENIAGGMNLSASEAVGWWQGDSLHLNTMLGASYTDAGAGVAEADGRLYYTLDVGYVAGEAAPPPSGGNAPAGTSAASTPAPTALAIIPVKVSTPREDGSIVHEVKQGQALWNIAAAYKVSLADLMALNGLTQGSFIYPGDKLLVRPAQATSTPTPSEVPTSTITPTRTLTPLVTIALAQAPPTGVPSPEGESSPIDESSAEGFDPLLGVIIGLVMVGAGLVAFGVLFKRQPQ
jgi:LysM repeat protein